MTEPAARLDGVLLAHPRAAAQAALRLATHAAEPSRAALLAALPASVFDGAVTARLVATAQALLAPGAAPAALSIPAEELAAAEAIKHRLQKILEYHLADDPQGTAELAEIRAGSGPLDLASDLSRYATLCEVHRDRLAGDRHFRPEDVADARAAASTIVADLQAVAAANGEGERRRLLAALAEDYAELHAALTFVGRREPSAVQAARPTLRAAVQASARPLPAGLGAVVAPLLVDVTPSS